MKSIKSWFVARRMGSTDSLDCKPSAKPLLCSHQVDTRTQSELTSLQIQQLLEQKQYQHVVGMLRELSHDFILKCLESFPFKALNQGVPETFPIWETLLTKLHNSEEGYIPQFPYAACDELVVQIAWQLHLCKDATPAVYHSRFPSCKRVLKKVYMQYNEVAEQLYKENDKVDHALYTLGLHLPLGSDCTAVTLHQAILEEVKACLVDYSDSVERLEELSQNEVLSLSDALLENQTGSTSTDNCAESPMDFPLAPNPSQLQVQERLYFNQCIFNALQPSRRRDTLSELLELLKERIRGDKEVLAIFARIRKCNETILETEPVEPWLRRYQHGMDSAIAMLKEIEKELQITIPRTDSPMDTAENRNSTCSEEGPLIVPVNHSRSLEEDKSPFIPRRNSAAILDEYLWEEEDMKGETPDSGGGVLYPPPHQRRRARSASPHKILRIGGPGIATSGSCKSVDSGSENGSNLINNTSSSIHDLQSTRAESHPVPAFTRVQSLKTRSSVVAGKRKSTFSFLPTSLTNLSTSNGNVSRPKSKKLFRSGSGGLVPWDRQSGEGMSANQFMLQQEVEYKTKELLHAREVIHELRKRERELTDRLSEQAQRHLQEGEKFEDILLGMSRPTMVVQRYQELYSQERVEALDAIEGAEGMAIGKEWGAGSAGRRNFGMQFVLDVLKFACSVSGSSLEKLHREWKSSLGVNGIQDKVAVKQLESAVGLFLRRVCSTHDISTIIKETESQLFKKYSEPPAYIKIKRLQPFRVYLEECVRVAWELSVQTPPMVINFSEREFSSDLHTRFFNANKDCSNIVQYLWPTLLQSSSGPILVRGVVMT